MTGHTTEPSRRFRVRSWSEDGHRERIVTEPTFEAAAISYAEHLPLRADARTDVRVLVHDIDSGHEHTFLIDLGEAASRQIDP